MVTKIRRCNRPHTAVWTACSQFRKPPTFCGAVFPRSISGVSPATVRNLSKSVRGFAIVQRTSRRTSARDAPIDLGPTLKKKNGHPRKGGRLH